MKKAIFQRTCLAGLILASALGFSQCASQKIVVPFGVDIQKAQPCSEYMPKGFVYVDQAAPLVKADLRYAGTDNFIGRPMVGYLGKRAILREEAAKQLKLISQDLDKKGYKLIVYDAYRPHTAMEEINRWGKDLNDQKMKSVYYPNIDKARIFKDRYLGPISEHSRGVAVDVALIVKTTGKLLDVGGHFDLLDPSSHITSPLVSEKQRANRQILKQAMEKHGFINYEPEWWHYRLASEPDEQSYFLFSVCDNMKEE